MQIELTPEEQKAVQIALFALIRDHERMMDNPKLPWTEPWRKASNEMSAASRTALQKFQEAGGVSVTFPPRLDRLSAIFNGFSKKTDHE